MKPSKETMTLNLECWSDDLSPAQIESYEKMNRENKRVKEKLQSILSDESVIELFSGDFFNAYQVVGNIIDTLKKSNLYKDPKEQKPKEIISPPKKRIIVQDDDDEDVPLVKRAYKLKETMKQKVKSRVSPKLVKEKKLTNTINTTTTTRSPKNITEKDNNNKTTEATVSSRPSEITSVGGLTVGTASSSKDDIKTGPDSRELVFNKLQAKTFPSLVVVARSSLKVKNASRTSLDSKVKIVLMMSPAKFTEWLIQQGLLKSEQKCAVHSLNDLKLGVYSEVTKFPFSGGYVWISECCPTRFVSVFYGSLFEGSLHPPSSILKLIYHWSCQSNIQNVVQWVKVDNVFIKGIYTALRATCTVALYRHMKPMGGPGKHIEVGVISLGTTTQDGQQRQVKVEVLGVLDHAEKIIRLRAIEPYADTDKNYKKRFVKILEPLTEWVSKDSIITIDMTVDKTILLGLGYKNILQVSPSDANASHTNANVMEYLRRIVPRMFQNTLSLLSRQMIQQFLDELVWREQFGTWPLETFNNIVKHIAEVTKLEGSETLSQRLFKVAANPFKDWSNLHDEDLTSSSTSSVKPNTSSPTAAGNEQKDLIEGTRRASRKHTASKESSTANSSSASESAEGSTRPRREPKISNKKLDQGDKMTSVNRNNDPELDNFLTPNDDNVGLEETYYGIIIGRKTTRFECLRDFSVECPECDSTFDDNVQLQKDIINHFSSSSQDNTFQCIYCLEKWESDDTLQKHYSISHPIYTKNPVTSTYNCIICENRFNSIQMLNIHMQKVHIMLELPYKCTICKYRSSSHPNVIDHFYEYHGSIGALQCPLCLLIFRIFADGKTILHNVYEYYRHMEKHFIKSLIKKCGKCCLSFTDKGSLRTHLLFDHESYLGSRKVKKLLDNTLYIPIPKVKNIVAKESLSFKRLNDLDSFKIQAAKGKLCLECDTDLQDDEHILGLIKCQKCRYQTYCVRAMMEHTGSCQLGVNPESNVHINLDMEMHCVCGFSSSDGNSLARHLAVCEHKSAYPSVEAAQDNTVKRNMLDMLGLMRRSEETSNSKIKEQ